MEGDLMSDLGVPVETDLVLRLPPSYESVYLTPTQETEIFADQSAVRFSKQVCIRFRKNGKTQAVCYVWDAKEKKLREVK